MIATIKQVDNGYLAHYERHLEHDIVNAWAMLTDNGKLEQWFQELRMGKSGKGGFMNFEMQEEKFERLEIYEFVEPSVLSFDWFGDTVRFELKQEKNGCSMTFTEKFKAITEQTSKDLAGWHVCLDVIKSLLDGKSIEARSEDWENWHVQYVGALDRLAKM